MSKKFDDVFLKIISSRCWELELTDTSDLHAWTGQGSESRLSTRARGLCPVKDGETSQSNRQTWCTGKDGTCVCVCYLLPPVALSLICSAVIPSSLQRWATSWAANMAAYGEDSSLSAFTFIPPVTRQMVSLTPQTQMRTNPSPVEYIQCSMWKIRENGIWT